MLVRPGPILDLRLGAGRAGPMLTSVLYHLAKIAVYADLAPWCVV